MALLFRFLPVGSFFTKAVDKAKDLSKTDDSEKLLNEQDKEDTVTNQVEGRLMPNF